MEKPALNVNEEINLDAIQYIQDNYAKATGLSFVTVDYKGREITKTSGFQEFCTRGRMQKDFCSLCGLCDAHGGLHSAIAGKPYIYYCHAGLVDFAIPLIVDGNYLGAVMGGQAKLPKNIAKDLEYIIPTKAAWMDDPLMRKCYDTIEEVPIEKIKSVVTLMQDTIQQLTERKNKNSISQELSKKNVELMEEKARSRKLEEEIQQNKDLVIGYESLFDMLNTLSGLGYSDGSQRVCDAVDDIAGILRYSFKSQEVSTLEDELLYADRLLSLHTSKCLGNFDYQIDVEKKHFGLACPFMTLKPTVEYAIQLTAIAEKGNVSIFTSEQDDILLLTIQCNGRDPGMDNVRSISQPVDTGREKIAIKDLNEINKKLKGFYGHRSGLEIDDSAKDESVTEVTIKIPIG